MRNRKSISVLPYSSWSFISHCNITKVHPLWTGVHKKSSENIIHHLEPIKSYQKMGQFSRKDFKQNTKPASYCTLLSTSAVHWWPEPVRLTNLSSMHCTPNSPEGPSSWARAEARSRELAGHSDKWQCHLLQHSDLLAWGARQGGLVPGHHWRCSRHCSPMPSSLGGSRLAAELGDNNLSLTCQFSFFHSHIIESIRCQWSVFQHHFPLLKGECGQETGSNSSPHTELVQGVT